MVSCSFNHYSSFLLPVSWRSCATSDGFHSFSDSGFSWLSCPVACLSSSADFARSEYRKWNQVNWTGFSQQLNNCYRTECISGQLCRTTKSTCRDGWSGTWAAPSLAVSAVWPSTLLSCCPRTGWKIAAIIRESTQQQTNEVLFWHLETPNTNLPLAFRMPPQLIESPSVVGFVEIAEKEEGQEEAEPAPHPRVETFNCDVHVVPFAQRFQSIQTALLVSKLQILHETWEAKLGQIWI